MYSWDAEVSPTYTSLDVPRPFAETHRDSTGSSVYSLPDNPAPDVPQVSQQVARPLYQPNRRPPLGPPPSARRGPASYYPQTNHVAPILEESDHQRGLHDSKSSFASSNAIPIGISRHLADQHDMLQAENSPFQDQYEDSDSSETEQMRPALVRQASIGRKSVPVLTTIKNGDLRPDSQTRPLGPISTQSSSNGRSVHHDMRRGSAPEDIESEMLEMNLPMVDISPEERSGESYPTLSARTSSSDILDKDAIVTSYENASLPSNYSEKHSKRVGSRRPPRLNVDAVREAEARGSLTSLPDLIRRATKVASNLDRGRTASRLGFNFFEDEAQKAHAPENRRSGSLSDILASFPPPGLATPTGSRGGSRGSKAMPWTSNLQHSSLTSESDLGEAHEQRRACCGMPLWLFLTLLLLVIILIAAAVLIPIILVVIPQQNGSHNSASASALATCQQSLDCRNGGINILGSDGSCSCLCVNGFAGSECSQSSSVSCTTTNVGNVNNATLGDSIPRLLTGSGTNFSIPLNASNILGLFASSKLTCTSENALVTFNGLSARALRDEVLESNSSPTKVLSERADSTSVAGAAVTSNGIVFASGSARTASPSPVPSDSSGNSSSSSLSSPLSDATTLDFARVAVLLVFQESGQLNDAITAQENLQSYFTSGTTSTGQLINASGIDLGANMSANLLKRSVTLSNGTVIGA
ncbi:hypothetical protein E4T38_09087 [Aureobasidium subglaciale]|nr:hypothetical protein E4T38_09087 [Aureobasidium subglaciale]KAI5217109.1 hypothetical protein E4T41_08963 [Aureobasidium subglaciale]KAI5223308.1 hypothetical protein E4T40_04555 [Aureobasidium subglaciale]KAI5254926.1 hypothetical protein E4T46_08997 [Aureobasidium subglaciale]